MGVIRTLFWIGMLCGMMLFLFTIVLLTLPLFVLLELLGGSGELDDALMYGENTDEMY